MALFGDDVALTFSVLVVVVDVALFDVTFLDHLPKQHHSLLLGSLVVDAFKAAARSLETDFRLQCVLDGSEVKPVASGEVFGHNVASCDGG